MHPRYSLQLTITLICFISLSSCDTIQRMGQESQAIKDNLQKSCDCEDVRLTNFNNTNGVESADVEIVGSPAQDHKAESQRLYNILLKNVKHFKKIDHFTFTFINKGKGDVVEFQDNKLLSR